MKTEDKIIETIKISMDFFKIYVAIVIVLTGAIFGFVVQIHNDPAKNLLDYKDPFNLIVRE